MPPQRDDGEDVTQIMKLFGKRRQGGEARHDEAARHIALIMDGNGRWAKSAACPFLGHAAERKLSAVLQHTAKHRHRIFNGLCLFNGKLKRPADEAQAIMTF